METVDLEGKIEILDCLSSRWHILKVSGWLEQERGILNVVHRPCRDFERVFMCCII